MQRVGKEGGAGFDKRTSPGFTPAGTRSFEAKRAELLAGAFHDAGADLKAEGTVFRVAETRTIVGKIMDEQPQLREGLWA